MKKLRRKDILILAVIAVVLFVYTNYRLSRHRVASEVTGKVTQISEKRYFEQKKSIGVSEAEKIECKIFSFGIKSDWVQANGSGHLPRCKIASPHAESCQIVHDLLFNEHNTWCYYHSSYEFCEVKRLRSASRWTVSCDSDDTSACRSHLYMGLLEPQGGSLVWEEFSSLTSLENYLMQVIHDTGKASRQRNFGFCFIRCGNESQTDSGPNDEAMYGEDYYQEIKMKSNQEKQLLILPPLLPSLKHQTEKLKDIFGRININMILIDSVSRQHFYRSLTETAFYLEELNSGVGGSVASVLDFEFMQAVSSRTFETLQILFSGDTHPSIISLGTTERPTKPLNLKPLLGSFKSMGYRTLWLEDLCQLWEWDISKDKHFLEKNSSAKETWGKMRQKLAENMVDDIDMTLAQCKLLAGKDINKPFNSTDTVCFNGRFQHEYIFEYLSFYHDSIVAKNQSFFSFTATSVGNEQTGRRIQSLDSTLSEYVRTAARLDNTLTILFSTHGNSHGTFVKRAPDNRLEVFHPFMFFIIPNSVSSKLGHKNMRSLGTNSQRLVSALDLHYTLSHLSNPASTVSPSHREYFVSRRGLFDPISSSKTCKEMPLQMPNLCICENFD